jgi:hypothetical protein
MPSRSASFFDHPDSTFDFRDVLVGTRQVDHRSTWYRLNHSLEGLEFPVGMHRRDVKAALEILLIYLLERFEYLRHCLVWEMIDCREAYLSAE